MLLLAAAGLGAGDGCLPEAAHSPLCQPRAPASATPSAQLTAPVPLPVSPPLPPQQQEGTEIPAAMATGTLDQGGEA